MGFTQLWFKNHRIDGSRRQLPINPKTVDLKPVLGPCLIGGAAGVFAAIFFVLEKCFFKKTATEVYLSAVGNLKTVQLKIFCF